MNILVDRHHDSLHWSWHLLFEKRLGGKVYIPYGLDWYDQGYYRLYGHLGMPDPYRWIAELYLKKTIYNYDGKTGMADGLEARKGCQDYPKLRCLTLEQAKETPLDIIICSVRENEKYFRDFKEDFHPNAKLIRQSGNQLDETNHNMYPNMMCSSICTFEMSKAEHKILYRQEFDTEFFKHSLPKNANNIYSFINGMAERSRDTIDSAEIWFEMEHELKDINFRSYGVGCEYGRIFKKRILVEKMRAASLIYNVKYIDGYGHIPHNAMCLGRPLILKRKCYEGKLLEPLLEDGKSCVYIDDGFEKVKDFMNLSKLRIMSEWTANRFKQIVNFDEEFENTIKPFLEDLR